MAFGVWAVHVPASEFAAGSCLNFTRRYGDAWEGVDHVIMTG